MYKIILLSIVSLAFITACSRPNFMGAEMYNSLKGFYAERWYLNPEYNEDEIPKGTKFYGVSADKIKHKFIVRYYIIKPNGNNMEEIPKKDMWMVKQENYLYVKDINNKFIKSEYAPGGKYDLKFIPIKECIDSKWCKLYENMYDKELYIKRSAIEQR
ncbi:MAG: hypothetical protein OQK11_08735 [Thiovulaceae bacterium]|nr:hypothetical protein [Sulfurimonadaceae bacterium]